MDDEKILQFEQELQQIKQRNIRVEADKAWETSPFRIATLCLITYLVATTLMYFIRVEHFLLSALIPTAGFFLSTQSLPWIKRWWIKNKYKL